MFHIYHKKMNEFDAENFTKITANVKRVEDRLFQQRQNICIILKQHLSFARRND